MDNLVGTAANYLVTAVLAALVGWLGSQMRRERDERDKRKTHDDAMEMGMRALLRQQLIDYHRDYVVSGGPCPVRIKEQATSVYQAYHSLGGNGTGTQLWEEIMRAHVDAPDDI